MPAEPSVAHFRVSLALDARPQAAQPHTSLVSRFKLILRIGGVTALFVGLMSCPVGYRVSPKRDLSAFDNFADIWAFFEFGLILIGIGLIAFLLPFFLPGDDEYWK
jgi:hypothetical protein